MIASIAQVDVVHCICYGTLVADLAILASRVLLKRVFITDVGGRGSWSLVRYGDIFRFASGLLPLSEFSSRSFPGTRPPRKVIYGGVDTRRFAPGKANRQQVLYVGRLLPHKGIDYLIDALLPEWSMTVVGRPYDPAYFDTLKNLAEGKNVQFRVNASDEEVAAEMGRSAVAVLPSVLTASRGSSHPLTELLGLTVLEAMASETPVVCTTVASLPEIVENGVTGLLVPPNDSNALYLAIDRILSDEKSARDMGRAGRRRVLHRFTWGHVAETCLRAYRELA
jgi:glycosyltransferase involved in cell wall biosynthesis